MRTTRVLDGVVSATTTPREEREAPAVTISEIQVLGDQLSDKRVKVIGVFEKADNSFIDDLKSVGRSRRSKGVADVDPVYYAFDLTFCDGADLTRLPMATATARLQTWSPANMNGRRETHVA